MRFGLSSRIMLIDYVVLVKTEKDLHVLKKAGGHVGKKENNWSIV